MILKYKIYTLIYWSICDAILIVVHMIVNCLSLIITNCFPSCFLNHTVIDILDLLLFTSIQWNLLFCHNLLPLITLNVDDFQWKYPIFNCQFQKHPGKKIIVTITTAENKKLNLAINYSQHSHLQWIKNR